MRRRDIRFSGQAATIEHHSARGRVVRNAGNFTRGSQLVTHEFLMTWAGVKVPLLLWLLTFALITSIILGFRLQEHEFQLITMRAYSWLWDIIDLDPQKVINLTLPDGSMLRIPMLLVPLEPHVQFAWAKTVRTVGGAFIMSAFIAVPLTLWFVDFSKRRGREILQERHERGAMLVEAPVLLQEVQKFNNGELKKECAEHHPPLDLGKVRQASLRDRVKRGIHAPYTVAGIPYPWRLEQSHTMLIGTTGAGKTTQLRSLVAQLRRRGHRAVIFDLTGAFVEAFYRPASDVILNPMDVRCPPWTIFNDCQNYADFVAAAAALIPSDGHNSEPFWAMAARTLFVEMCQKLVERGETTNAAIAHNLMTADLKRVHALLKNSIADPLSAPEAARMAESIRAVFNTNAQVIRFLPDPVPGQSEPFSINAWMEDEANPGGLLFVTSNHTDLTMNRALLTLWMDMAVNALLRLPRTRDLRTWFLFDEVHALHRLPAIEHGLQTSRAFGGAFVLGIHSFEKLAETYGEQGAINLGSLARTKLILATADIETAKRSADFIGNREVRQMDEAYSYGYNNTRDASTLTPKKAIEPLVIPDDITNLPSLHGFVKFPDGFPAARVKLQYQSYPEVAPGFDRRTTMIPSPYMPAAPANAEGESEEAGGWENATPKSGEKEFFDPTTGEILAASMFEKMDAPSSDPDVTGELSRGNDPENLAKEPGKVTHYERLADEARRMSDEKGGLFKALQARPVMSSGSDTTKEAEHAKTARTAPEQGRSPDEDPQVRELREGAGVEEEEKTQRTIQQDLDYGYGD